MKKNFLKTIMILGALTLYLFPAYGQSPEKMSYQAVIRNSSDQLVTDQLVGMQISILQGSASGTAVYVETQTPTTNANGLVSIEIGDGTVVSGDFTTIDWANGPYFIKTETDPTGGINYTITGTSQLLSVPYALHAKTAESISGTVTETDPIFTGSQAANITATDITNLGNLSGVNTGDQDLSALATKTALGDSTAQVRSEIPDVSGFLTSETDPSVPTGTQAGDMQYWNGTAWVTVAAGYEGATLQMIGGVPTWTGGTPPSVTNPTTGKIWMDRNLGASQVATSSTDAAAYGDLYQWGRGADGHQSRTSSTTTTLSTSDTPGHGNFITTGDIDPCDWRSPQNDNLWQGVSGTNNPCPSGYRLPTEAEWNAERTSWGSNNAAGAFASPLKLPMAGSRLYSDGSLDYVGSLGVYWSSTVFSTNSRGLSFNSSNVDIFIDYRALGLSVRCIKD
ncbi:MAG: FISUMP domain-containing protein [Bacteroidales bacterium]|nr:FISUMP domain-containing protein [Bacteroidales bacterium]